MSSNVIPNISESPTVSLIAAGKALGIGRTSTYAMLRRGDFPLPIVGTKGKHRVPTAALRRILELDLEENRPAAEKFIKTLVADPRLSTADRYQLALMLIGDAQ